MWGEETDPTLLSTIPGGYGNPLVSALGVQPAETWCPNRGSGAPGAGTGEEVSTWRLRTWGPCSVLGIVWVHPTRTVRILYLETPVCSLPAVCLVPSEIPILWTEGVALIDLWSLFFSSSCHIHLRSGSFQWVPALCSAEWGHLGVSFTVVTHHTSNHWGHPCLVSLHQAEVIWFLFFIGAQLISIVLLVLGVPELHSILPRGISILFPLYPSYRFYSLFRRVPCSIQ